MMEEWTYKIVQADGCVGWIELYKGDRYICVIDNPYEAQKLRKEIALNKVSRNLLEALSAIKEQEE